MTANTQAINAEDFKRKNFLSVQNNTIPFENKPLMRYRIISIIIHMKEI